MDIIWSGHLIASCDRVTRSIALIWSLMKGLKSTNWRRLRSAAPINYGPLLRNGIRWKAKVQSTHLVMTPSAACCVEVPMHGDYWANQLTPIERNFARSLGVAGWQYTRTSGQDQPLLEIVQDTAWTFQTISIDRKTHQSLGITLDAIWRRQLMSFVFDLGCYWCSKELFPLQRMTHFEASTRINGRSKNGNRRSKNEYEYANFNI